MACDNIKSHQKKQSFTLSLEKLFFEELQRVKLTPHLPLIFVQIIFHGYLIYYSILQELYFADTKQNKKQRKKTMKSLKWCFILSFSLLNKNFCLLYYLVLTFSNWEMKQFSAPIDMFEKRSERRNVQTFL